MDMGSWKSYFLLNVLTIRENVPGFRPEDVVWDFISRGSRKAECATEEG